MRNERLHDGDEFSAPVANDTPSGTPVLALDAIPAVTSTKEGEGGNIAGRASVKCKGVFSLPCADAIAAEATEIFIDGTTLTTDDDTGANPLFGWTVHNAEGTGGTKSAGAGNVNIRLAKV